MNTKICNKCKVEKSLDDFHNKKDTIDGKTSICKECRLKTQKQYYNDNKEIISEKFKVYYQANKDFMLQKHKKYRLDNDKKIKIQQKVHYQANKDYILNRNKKYRETHREEVLIAICEWNKNNPAKVKSYRNKQKSKRRGWASPIPINTYFEGSHLHHLHLLIDGKIDHRAAIFIPEHIHKSVRHAYNKKETMDEINKLAFEWLATQSIIEW